MSIEQINNGNVTEEKELNEREYYKQRADQMGISYHSNIPTEKLKELVKAKLADTYGSTSATEDTIKKLAPAVMSMQEKATALVRFRLRVLDPSKADWTGMYVSVGNDNLAPIKRAIYFIDEPWHAERIIVDALKGMQYAYRPSKENKKLKGTYNDMRTPKIMPVFHIEELPPLTPEELHDLAIYQAQNNTGQQETD